MSKEDAIAQIMAISKRNELQLTDIEAAFNAKEDHQVAQKKRIVNNLFGYVGGLLIFAGIIIFIGMKWDDINVVGQIFLTLGFGFCAFIIAVTCAKQQLFEKAATPLFLIAAILQPMGMVIFLKEYTVGGDPAKALLFISLVLLIQQGLVFLSIKRTVLLFTSLFFMFNFYVAAFDLLNVPYKEAWFVLSVSSILIAWATHNSRHHSLSGLLFFIGSLSFFLVTFDILKHHPYEILYLGASCAMIYLAIAISSRTLLINSSLATLAYIGYFTGKNFPNTVGWPITLIIMGIILILLSSLVIKLDHKYIKSK